MNRLELWLDSHAMLCGRPYSYGVISYALPLGFYHLRRMTPYDMIPRILRYYAGKAWRVFFKGGTPLRMGDSVQFTPVIASFFDYSIGREVDRNSRSYKEGLKRRNRVVMSEEESEQEATKNRSRNIKEFQDKENKEYIGELERSMYKNKITPIDIIREMERVKEYHA